MSRGEFKWAFMIWVLLSSCIGYGIAITVEPDLGILPAVVLGVSISSIFIAWMVKLARNYFIEME